MAWIPRLASFPQFLTIRYTPLAQSLPVCLRCSPDSTVPACIAPLHPVCNPGYHNGSDTLATLGSSAIGLCPSFRCPCGVLISAVACGLDPSSYLLPFGWIDTMCQVAGPLLPGFPPSLVSSLYALSAFQVSVMVPICWTPSTRLPSGSVLAFAVTAVFYASVSRPSLVAISCCRLVPSSY